MKLIWVNHSRTIKSYPDEDDAIFLKNANIFFAGGDTEKGWNIQEKNDWDRFLLQK